MNLDVFYALTLTERDTDVAYHASSKMAPVTRYNP